MTRHSMLQWPVIGTIAAAGIIGAASGAAAAAPSAGLSTRRKESTFLPTVANRSRIAYLHLFLRRCKSSSGSSSNRQKARSICLSSTTLSIRPRIEMLSCVQNSGGAYERSKSAGRGRIEPISVGRRIQSSSVRYGFPRRKKNFRACGFERRTQYYEAAFQESRTSPQTGAYATEETWSTEDRNPAPLYT
jgi:hypothetical protein